MIGLDTNVLVRFIVQDDPMQSQEATYLIEKRLTSENKGFVSSIVLCEVLWVLKRAYRQPKEQLLVVVKLILEADVLEVENRDCAWRAYYDYDEGPADFSDYYIAQINKAHGASITVTFDDNALKHRLFKSPSFDKRIGDEADF